MLKASFKEPNIKQLIKFSRLFFKKTKDEKSFIKWPSDMWIKSHHQLKLLKTTLDFLNLFSSSSTLFIQSNMNRNLNDKNRIFRKSKKSIEVLVRSFETWPVSECKCLKKVFLLKRTSSKLKRTFWGIFNKFQF